MPSILKVNQIQKTSSTSNIINKSGSTITLGSCGTTVTLACGATSTGFAASSFVDWCTTAKTAPFTGANGTGYFVNTSCGAITVTLPATPTAGDIVSLKDYGGTWATNSVTVCNNGSKINGVCAVATLNTNSQSVTLIYVDSTKGWQDIQDSTAAVKPEFITATGGTITTCGDYKIHTFTSDGTFCVSALSCNPVNNSLDYLVVAAGGGGADNTGGGGGAGGYRTSFPGGTSLPVSVQAYPVTVGAGGTGGITPSGAQTNGSPSIFSSITSAGGGFGAGGGGGSVPYSAASPGGSGGGGSITGQPNATGGTGNTPPTSPPQGNPGGNGNPLVPGPAGGGGGGASASGQNYCGTSGGDGGDGLANSISGSSIYYAGGGGGAPNAGIPGVVSSGGLGGGGPSGIGTSTPNNPGTPGTVNTGGGGGGSGAWWCAGTPGGGNGGSGIVILRYRYQ